VVVIVTNDVPMRFRGFLASCSLEIAPGVYTAPHMSAAVRQRVWGVLDEWYSQTGCTGSIVMTWDSPEEPAGQGVLCLGTLRKQLIEYDGFHLCVTSCHERRGLARHVVEEDVSE